ncbi:heavy-metal-associated domain-containing protein [Parasporobacterium paucivorans]|uniref:Copper chaperone n=1 Tax=Parasporobacterium paucivorans DSM 15970 TaxID=1122934 RepID=A0A1M6KBF0_9FIRM|nr:heavy metal-associated domain-containing protein [Parasporobacterium paucivorans]SHJ56189.1 copper chaperone [Parasporobacterium paucivorans DSM 15970]
MFGRKKANLEMNIEGMTCGHCSQRVENALNGLDGVQATVDLNKKKAFINLSGEISEETLKAAIEDAGYTVTGIVRNK